MSVYATNTQRRPDISDTSAINLLSNPQTAAAILQPLRRDILASLREPASAAEVSRRLSVPRQKINYHMRALEEGGLIELVEERRRGNCAERVMRASARFYVIDPQSLGELNATVEEAADPSSATYLVALASESMREVASLRQRADATGGQVPTLAAQLQVRFATADDLRGFFSDLSQAVSTLVARYHSATPQGRPFKLNLMSYPGEDD